MNYVKIIFKPILHQSVVCRRHSKFRLKIPPHSKRPLPLRKPSTSFATDFTGAMKNEEEVEVEIEDEEANIK